MRFRLPFGPSSAASEPGETLAVRLDVPDPPSDFVALYLHGFGSSQDGTKADLLRSRFVDRGIAFCSFDFRGHGDSDGSMFDLSLSRNVEDVALVHAELERRGFGRVLLFGSSMGGLTGLWYSVETTRPLLGAVHLAPALGLEESFTSALGSEQVERWQRDGQLEIGHDLGTWDIGWGFVEDLRAHDVVDLCLRYHLPTLIFQGKHDTSVPWRRVIEFATQAAGEEIEVHLFADGDHRMIERLPRLWNLTEEFLVARKLSSPRA